MSDHSQNVYIKSTNKIMPNIPRIENTTLKSPCAEPLNRPYLVLRKSLFFILGLSLYNIIVHIFALNKDWAYCLGHHNEVVLTSTLWDIKIRKI